MSEPCPILMPKLGLTMTEGLISSWRVRQGDTVAAGDVLFVVETDKIATEVEAQGPGQIVDIKAGEGDTIAVGAVVATWTGQRMDDGLDPETVYAKSGLVDEGSVAAESKASAAARQEAKPRIVATPLARRRARQAGISLQGVTGSGSGGRIKLADVEAALTVAHAVSGRSRPASQAEKVIARRLAAAKREIPHFYVFGDADVSRLIALQQELNAGAASHLTLTHFIVKAAAAALQRLPEFNVLWDDDAVFSPETIDIGIAVNADRGLVAPVLRNVDGLTLDGVSHSMRALVERARSGRLAPSDLEGGTMSVSNIGMFGASYLLPIINPGQSSILGVAAVKPLFRPDGAGNPSLRQEVGLVLSCDHRVLGGVAAAKFLNLVVDLLNNPLALLRA